MTRIRPRLLAVCLAAAAVLPASSAVAVPAQATSRPESWCAWPREIGAESLNVALPDSNASYWVTQYEVHPDREITISGTFPDTRYVSFTVYDGVRGAFTSNGVSSHLTDYEIAPDPGSVNPWQTVAAPGGKYTLHLTMDAAPGETNTIPLAPAGSSDNATGYLIYREYLPEGGTFRDADLPVLTITDAGVAQTLRTCRRTPTSPAGPARLGVPAPVGVERADLAFARDSTTDSLFPNPDSGYLNAWVTPPGPRAVVVLRGKGATSADSAHPTPWPGRGDDMRYWSVCTDLRLPFFPVVINDLPGGGVDPGCRHDDAVTLDADGYYTVVIGTEEQRAQVEAVPGATFVPFSLDQPNARHLVLLRNMLPRVAFTESVLDVPANGDPQSAEATMGEYYPHAAVCPVKTLQQQGAEGCGL